MYVLVLREAKDDKKKAWGLSEENETHFKYPQNEGHKCVIFS